MQVKFGSIVTAGVGKLGGHQFQRGRGATQLITKRSGHKRHNKQPTQQQILFAKLVAMWQAMTPEERFVWSNQRFLPRDRGPLNTGGEPLNGWSAFVMINTWRTYFELELITDNFVRDVQAQPEFPIGDTLGTISQQDLALASRLVVESIFGEPYPPTVINKIAVYDYWQALPEERDHVRLVDIESYTGAGNPRYVRASNPIIEKMTSGKRVSVITYAVEGYAASEGFYRVTAEVGDDDRLYRIN